MLLLLKNERLGGLCAYAGACRSIKQVRKGLDFRIGRNCLTEVFSVMSNLGMRTLLRYLHPLLLVANLRFELQLSLHQYRSVSNSEYATFSWIIYPHGIVRNLYPDGLEYSVLL